MTVREWLSWKLADLAVRVAPEDVADLDHVTLPAGDVALPDVASVPPGRAA